MAEPAVAVDTFESNLAELTLAQDGAAPLEPWFHQTHLAPPAGQDSVPSAAASQPGGSAAATVAPAVPPPAALRAVRPPPEARKRGPGRPSKVPPPRAMEHHGIVDKPRFADNQFELGSEQPPAFKKLSGFFDKIKAEDIHVHITPTGLKFYTEDNSGLLRVMAVVRGDRMNHYYCEKEFWLGLNQSHVSKIFSSINKSFHRIKLYYRPTEMVLHIVLSNTTLNKDNCFPTPVSSPMPNPQWLNIGLLFDRRQDYKVSWTVPQAIFKKTHEIAHQTATTIKVELVGGAPLALKYVGTGIEDYSEVYRDSTKIALESKLVKGEPFAVDYSALAGKTLSAATPAEHVTIFCTENSPLLFLSDEDDAGIFVMTAMDPVV
jgi:hypothetical protein